MKKLFLWCLLILSLNTIMGDPSSIGKDLFSRRSGIDFPLPPEEIQLRMALFYLWSLEAVGGGLELETFLCNGFADFLNMNRNDIYQMCVRNGWSAMAVDDLFDKTATTIQAFLQAHDPSSYAEFVLDILQWNRYVNYPTK